MEKLTKEKTQEKIDSNFGEGKVAILSEVVNKRSVIELKCNVCGHIWTTALQNVCYKGKQVKNKHCPNCLKKERESAWITTTCAYCGEKIKKRKSDIKSEHYNVFCDKLCSNRYKNDQREVFTINNYRDKALKYKANKCACCGWEEDIRVLEVHHKDNNRKHNALENLIVLCPICHRKITLGLYILNDEGDELIKVK